MTDVKALTNRTDDHIDGIIKDLKDLVVIPSVSAPSFDQSVLTSSANAVADLLRGVGMDTVDILTATTADGTTSPPAVVAHKQGPSGAPTVLLYAHHDVQPPGDPAEWTSPAFEPTERDGRLYGRGSADDKAGIMAHIGALRVLGDDLPVNVTVFIEGEEELGSPNFAAFLDEHHRRLKADTIVVADSVNWKIGHPALTTTLRGVVGANVTVRTLNYAVHSGMFGGPILDAVTAMSRLVTSLHEDDGTVAVAGLESADLGQVDTAEADFRSSVGAVDGLQLAGSGSLSSRLWSRPAINVVGMDVTDVDSASNTIIPECRAKLSMRVAPSQDPKEAAEALRNHLVASAPLGSQVEVDIDESGPGFAADVDTEAVAAATWALTTAFGQPTEMAGIGGSIPFIADLKSYFPNAEILVTGVEDPDSRAHGIDESVHLADHRNVVLAEALLLARLGDKG